jgi:ferric-dicitrate binding protein FerR (iron transport regulator)
MIPIIMSRPAVAAAAFTCMLLSNAVLAQSADMGCTLRKIAGAELQVLRCGRGLTITTEAGTNYTLVDADKDGQADGARLRSKAMRLEAPSGQADFQVITPQAIAAVRGTQWYIDVANKKTAVFVARGRVAVRSAKSISVFLGPGQGVDVESGAASLEVKTWKAKRVKALLARFGQ